LIVAGRVSQVVFARFVRILSKTQPSKIKNSGVAEEVTSRVTDQVLYPEGVICHES
jgi:hypothetical protein